MELGKRYKSKAGETIRTPLSFSECGKWVYCKVEYTNKTTEKWYFMMPWGGLNRCFAIELLD